MVLGGHVEGVSGLVDLGGGRLLSGEWAGLLRVWDVGAATPACLATSEGGECYVVLHGLCVRADGRFLWKGSIWAWDEESKALTQQGSLVGRTADIVQCMVSVGWGATQLLTGSHDSALRLWDVDASSGASWKETAVLRGHTGTVWSIAVVRAGRAPGLYYAARHCKWWCQLRQNRR